MLKKFVSSVVVFTMLVSVSGSAMAQKRALNEDDQTIERGLKILKERRNPLEFSEEEKKTIKEAEALLQKRHDSDGLNSKVEKKVEKKTNWIVWGITLTSAAGIVYAIYRNKDAIKARLVG
ncbi:MAG: hypothetical protein LBT58_03510 [Endomicrobium sp.]|jgi:hypothetical protein|nr:hypothetical protein [Endomicrobium sp.]